MTYIESWEEFCKAAERLYQSDPFKVRYSTAAIKFLVVDFSLLKSRFILVNTLLMMLTLHFMMCTFLCDK